MLSRAGKLLAALAAFGLGGFLAWHYPLGPGAALSLFALVGAVAFLCPAWCLVALPALLPVIGLAPWTGWFSFEESDLLVLAVAGGGYLRALVDGPPLYRHRLSRLLLALSSLLALSLLISLARGFADAGGFQFGWYQGYDGPMNSIRIGKSFFLALLLLPLLRRLFSDPNQQAGRQLAWGLALGLGSAGLAALWERLAFTGLLNFSSDYRSTALFWEMHVGGAALDGWLLLTAPFAVYALRHARTPARHALALGLIVLAAYVALTTFSRGVYLALLVSLPMLAWRTHRPAGARQPGQQPAWTPLRWAIALLVLAAMAGLVFANGGYRGLLALLGVLAVTLVLPQHLRGIAVAQWVAGVALGLMVGGALALLAALLPKGPYVLYLLLLAALFVVLWQLPGAIQGSQRIFLAAGWFALGLMAASAAHHWGGGAALWGMLGALAVVFAATLCAVFAKRPLWPEERRWQAAFISAAVAVSTVMAVFAGGAYMGGRFSTSSQDMEGRLDHWSLSMTMLETPFDLGFGKGLGRYPANYFFASPDSKFPGTYQWVGDDEGAWLSLVAPRHPLSFGDIFRVSQRLPFGTAGPFAVSLKVRAKNKVTLLAEVCEKHLLYVARCASGHANVKSGEDWQAVTIRLSGPLLDGGPWYAPRLRMFSLGIGNMSGAADVDDIILLGPGGESLLTNGDFNQDMQRWFFSSDRDHLPWHAKNILVNVLFDQGLFGLASFLLLTVAALWQLNLGRAREHELAPYLSAAITGFLVVGMFDSLIDVPRLALLFYVLLFLCFMLKNRSGQMACAGPI
ncbi:MAG: hypothetical protein LBE81_01455 [Azonexus sp.]|jgi:hypothetical protein|uniref:hypothetical protein n=1 Tax=Azonexus sp. TaxID=1872668 RepID=UPI0028348EAB|nr:hypothetical protein [Azonexus sp.]MDR0775293.1 hypothetical protein [Azonexus sp.]